MILEFVFTEKISKLKTLELNNGIRTKGRGQKSAGHKGADIRARDKRAQRQKSAETKERRDKRAQRQKSSGHKRVTKKGILQYFLKINKFNFYLFKMR